MAPARTGSLKTKRTAVIITAHKKRGIEDNQARSLLRAQKIVQRKLIAPIIEEAPARWREKIAISTPIPEWNWALERGGYTVHPVPTPLSITEERISSANEGIKSQKDKLFKRGKAMSTQPSIIGKSQFPKPPIAIGITIKKIITKAWAVTITL